MKCLKSNVVHFRKTRSAKSKYTFKLGDVCLGTVDRYKYLGLIFDEYLTFDLGVNDLCLKGGRALAACISRFKAFKDVGFITFTKLYNCMVTLYVTTSLHSEGTPHFKNQKNDKIVPSGIFSGLGHGLPFWQFRGRWAG